MSPLISSFGGSSEQSYRGTLDDWPVPFDANLASQNLVNQDPGTTVTASLTVTGLNYKTRITVEDLNASVSINGNTPVSALDSDPIVYVRDNDNIDISYTLPLVNKTDFSKTYTVPVKIGKRTGTWTITTRAIDNTPDSFTFTPQTGLDLGVTVNSNTVTISGLEPNFNFNISIGVDYFKNGSGPFTSGITTIRNLDTIQLTTTTPSTFATAESYTVIVEPPIGTYTTTWGIETRDADTIVDPISFGATPQVPQANLLSTIYTSSEVTVAGVDPGPKGADPFFDATAIPVSLATSSSSTAQYEIRKSDNSLRHPNPTPGELEFWQSNREGVALQTTNFAYLDDIIKVRVESSSSYVSDTSATLVLGTSPDTERATYLVRTRPQPYNTRPDAFTLDSITSASRATTIESNTITLSGITPGFFAPADISSFDSRISPAPQFRVQRLVGGILTTVKLYTDTGPFNVTNDDQITLRMTTPNINNNNGVGTFNVTFTITGENTETLSAANVLTGNGFVTQTGLEESSVWQVTTVARSCGPINSFSFVNLTGVPVSTKRNETFIADGFQADCGMTATISSLDSTSYGFIRKNTTTYTPSVTSLSVSPGDEIELEVESSASFDTDVTATVSVSNSTNPITPNQSQSADWTIRTTLDTADAVVTLTRSGTGTIIANNGNITLNWNTVNCAGFYRVPTTSASWDPGATPALTGTVTFPTPSTAGTYTYQIDFEANPTADNALPGGALQTAGQVISVGPPLRVYARGSITVNVIDDTSPVFVRVSDGSIITAVPERSLDIVGGVVSSASESVRITSITKSLGGVVSGDTGATFQDGTTTKNLNNSDTFILRVNVPTTYLTGPVGSKVRSSNTATLTLSDTAIPAVVGSIGYTVTANPCATSLIQEVTISSGALVNPSSITFNAYSGAVRYNDATTPTAILRTEPSPSNFITSSNIVASTGDYSTWAVQTIGLTPQVSGRNITWTEIKNLIFRIFNSATITYADASTSKGYNRNPTIDEFNTFMQTAYAIFLGNTIDGTNDDTIFDGFINTTDFSSIKNTLDPTNTSYDPTTIATSSSRVSNIVPGNNNTGIVFGSPCEEVLY